MKELTKNEFVAELIKALEDAELNALQAPLTQETLARNAWEKLQYDFPLVSVVELQALALAFDPSSLINPPMRLTDKFIDVVQEGSEVRREGKSGEEEDPEVETLVAAYQFLYGAALLGAMQRVLSVPVDEAIDLLRQISLPCSSSQSEEYVYGEEIPSSSSSSSSSSLKDALVEKTLFTGVEGEQGPPVRQSWEAVVEPIMIHIASKASYHKLSSDAAWKNGKLIKATEGCLNAIRTHAKFLQLIPAAGALCSLLHDRAVSCPTELDRVLSALASGLGMSTPPKTNDSMKESEATSALLMLGVGASLAERLPAGQARRHLWMHTRDTLLPIAALLLERCEVQRSKRARKGGNISNESGEVEEEVHAIAVASSLVEFFLLNAPGIEAKPSKFQDSLLTSGVYRGMILAFTTRGTEPRLEPLRRAVLACCAASPGLVTWAHAVPGFKAALTQEAFYLEGGEFYLYGSLHGCLSSSGNDDDDDANSSRVAVASCLRSKLEEGDGVPGIHAALRVVALVNSANMGALVWGEDVDSALGDVAVYLRAIGSEVGVDDLVEGAGEEEAEERKLRRSLDAQASLLASRQAQLLQPECLRMIKELRSKPGSLGKSD